MTAILGASVAILEGLQQLGQYNNLWLSYRATAEQLRHEREVPVPGQERLVPGS